MMKLISIEFDHNAMIPEKFTCQRKDVNPQVKFLDVPADAETLGLVVDDPDAPGRTWIHGVLFDIPLSGSGVEIKEGGAPGTEEQIVGVGLSTVVRSRRRGPIDISSRAIH